MDGLTQARLKELLHYDPETGVFTWRVDRGSAAAGSVAGGPNSKHLRWMIGINGLRRPRARLAWLYMTGQFPAPGLEIDHINRDSFDDRWSNLRVATRSQNLVNRVLPRIRLLPRGVFRQTKCETYQASISVNGKSQYLGTFPTPEEAHAAYVAAAKRIYGEFALVE